MLIAYVGNAVWRSTDIIDENRLGLTITVTNNNEQRYIQSFELAVHNYSSSKKGQVFDELTKGLRPLRSSDPGWGIVDRAAFIYSLRLKPEEARATKENISAIVLCKAIPPISLQASLRSHMGA
jgi:hypothetical protein